MPKEDKLESDTWKPSEEPTLSELPPEEEPPETMLPDIELITEWPLKPEETISPDTDGPDVDSSDNTEEPSDGMFPIEEESSIIGEESSTDFTGYTEEEESPEEDMFTYTTTIEEYTVIISEKDITNSYTTLEESKPNTEPWSEDSIESMSIDWELLPEQENTPELNIIED